MFKKVRFIAVTLSIIFALMMGVGMTNPDSGSQVKTKAEQQGKHFVSAQPGPIDVVQPDGSKLTIELFGDEISHIAKTTDGYTLLKDKNEFYYYAKMDKNGDMVRSTVKAANKEHRSLKEKLFLAKITRIQVSILQGERLYGNDDQTDNPDS